MLLNNISNHIEHTQLCDTHHQRDARLLYVKYFRILIGISLKFIPKGPIDNNPALV